MSQERIVTAKRQFRENSFSPAPGVFQRRFDASNANEGVFTLFRRGE